MVASNLKLVTRNLQLATNWFIGISLSGRQASAHWYRPIRLAGIGILVLLLASCETTDPKPKNMLSDAEMVKVLSELHLVEARADLLDIPQDSLRPLLEKRYEEIFAELDLDTAAFNATFAYYEHNPAQMDSLYQRVVDNLVELESNYRINAPDSTVVPQPIAVDSLNHD